MFCPSLDSGGVSAGGVGVGGRKRSGGNKKGNKAKKKLGGKLPVLRVPHRVVIPSDLSSDSVGGDSDRTDSLLADAARQTQRFHRIIQLRGSSAAQAAVPSTRPDQEDQLATAEESPEAEVRRAVPRADIEDAYYRSLL
jgi:hypothetical protein